ncbi:sensor histidine kinase [Emticicia agri]|uniref:sensor histidine kinase n=1 Tax=Emticicia agri TaxID=2492393 RepID=UPI0013EB1092|nr:sensor histidine kinase [Emticicia agri]
MILTGVFISIFIILVFYLYKLYQKQKLLSEHNAILIQEQNHRVKNNLQIISSLLSLQSNQLSDSKAKQAIDESQLRIEAMAVLHRQLYDTKELDKIDMELFIHNLSDMIFDSYGIEEVELEYHINIRPLKAEKAVFLGLMINELISNACKHAFAEHPAPVLSIDLSEKNHQITMRIKDNGLKSVSFQKKESFGMKLINMMVNQLDGHLSYEFNNGSTFTFKIA